MTLFKKKITLDGMLVASFLSTLFYSATFPFIQKTLITAISDNLIAMNQIICCSSIVISGTIWNKFGKKLFKYFKLYLILEIVTTCSLSAFVIITNNLYVYYILDVLMCAIITRQIICGRIKLRAIRYNDEESREHFDNNDNSAYSIAAILGSVIAMVIDLDFAVMIILATIGNIIDNVFYFHIYNKETRKVE